MKRRRLLHLGASASLLSLASRASAGQARAAMPVTLHRSRPGDRSWPTAANWAALDRQVNGRLIEVHSPFADCAPDAQATACRALFARLKNPYYIRDEVALTQTTGWIDAWLAAPSAYAVAARSAKDVAAAVDFARAHNVRIVVKGGGHSYQGTSNAPDSLLVWTRDMDDVVLHDAFVPVRCERSHAPVPAVSVGAGAIWMHVYQAVSGQANRYVQGGGCATVGVAGLVQSGRFGSFSKKYGTAAGALLEAEIVTADGAIRVVNACSDADLFWAIRGGGGGTFGVVTRLTLRTRELPSYFGGAFAAIRASSDASFRELVDRFIAFYRARLFNAHWGEVVTFEPDNVLRVAMVFQGLTKQQAADAWKPFIDIVSSSPDRFAFTTPMTIAAVAADQFWNPAFLLQHAPSIIVADTRPGAASRDVFWRSDLRQAGQYIHGYASAWLPDSLLLQDNRERLSGAIFAATRHWSISLHFNKGLAGAPAEAIAEAEQTAINPQALRAFALAIIGAEGPPAHPAVPGQEPDLVRGRDEAGKVRTAMNGLRRIVPDAGSYVSESDFFLSDWQQAFWAGHYPRLRRIKRRYDPSGLFVVHHGVGSEDWTADGFSRRA